MILVIRMKNMPQLDRVSLSLSPSLPLSLSLSVPLSLSVDLESLGVLSCLELPRKNERLANSHAAGVLHNDVASRNALLSNTQSGGRGLLSDFGISRVLRGGGVEAASLIDTDLGDNKWPVLEMPRECLEHPFPLTAESYSWMYGLFLYEVCSA